MERAKCKVTSTNGTQIYSEASRSLAMLSVEVKGCSFSCKQGVGCSRLADAVVIKELNSCSNQ